MRRLGVARALLATLVFACLVGRLHAATDESRVVILNGVDPLLPAFLATDNALRAEFAGATGGQALFFSESLDAQRFPEQAFEAELVALLAKKYRGVRIDVVVASTELSLEFFKRHGEQIWPGARVVYVGYPGESREPSALPPGATGVVSREDIAGTIEIARRLQPGARRIVVISGASEFDRKVESAARKALEQTGGPIPVEWLIGLPLPELATRVAALPRDSIVVFLTQFRDRDGRPYVPREVLRMLAEQSSAPIYGFVETFMGVGTVAGSIESFGAKGRLVAEQVRRMLAGEPPDPSRQLLDTPSQCIADARALARWSLNQDLLPVGCEIRFAVVPVWRQYWWQIALALLISAAEAALIAALLAQRRHRRLAEQAEQAQRAVLTRASRLAMAGELTGAIAHEINQPLGAILSNADAADLLLDSGADRRGELRAILADIRRDDLRASEVIQRLRGLLGKQSVERKELDLNDIVGDLESIMRAEARRRGVALETRRASESLAIIGDRIQLQEVLINLVLNAMDAVADQPEDRRRAVVSAAKGGGGAMLAVRDHGSGIAPEHRVKLFESLFSTKANGMGLGLSISRTIVEAHGGRIWFESDPGHGAIFQAEFPLAIASGAPAPQPA